VIGSDEIREIAATVRLQPTVVEKDYAIGWFLAGLNQHLATRENWVFKGGTCLKKCYFETYRFSEDLDFTFRGTTPPTLSELTQIFHEISDWIMNVSGLEIPKGAISFEAFQNPRGTTSIQGKAAYRGPITGNGNIQRIPKIKIDLTLDEPLVLQPATRKVEHAFSDLPENGIHILSYSLEEVFAEKTRALVQRLRPRDLYDVIHFYRRQDLKPDKGLVQSTLKSKCDLRGIPVPTIEMIETHDNRAALESEWENQLKHQLPVLPPFGEFLAELPLVLNWINGEEIEKKEPLTVSASGEAEGVIQSEAVQSMVIPGIGASMMEKIRFAAANRLLVQLGYGNDTREIEPYAFARSSEGNLLLRAIKSPSGDSRTYRWDRIQSIEVTPKAFQPSYEIEITSAGHLPVHQLTRSERISKGRSSGGPTYVFKCTRCGKQFKRKTMDSSLKEHKNPQGRTCYGSYGRYLRTE